MVWFSFQVQNFEFGGSGISLEFLKYYYIFCIKVLKVSILNFSKECHYLQNKVGVVNFTKATNPTLFWRQSIISPRQFEFFSLPSKKICIHVIACFCILNNALVPQWWSGYSRQVTVSMRFFLGIYPPCWKK